MMKKDGYSVERKVKPVWVRNVRFFCAVAVLTVASVEVWTNLSDASAMTLGGIVGMVATVAAKKIPFLA